jgi:hypothetical protein
VRAAGWRTVELGNFGSGGFRAGSGGAGDWQRNFDIHF